MIIYKQALKLLPAAYRDRYATPMVQTLEDMLADQTTAAAKLSVWLRTMIDLPITIVYQYAQIGENTMNQAPKYAKQGTVISAMLLLPFVVAIAVNSVHRLGASWSGFEYFCIFILPVISLLLSAVTLGRLLLAHDLLPRIKSFGKLQNNWMLLAVPLLAAMMVLFAFGHDSVHCLTEGHPSEIVHCLSTS